MFHEIIAHGMWGGALISTLLGTKLPGPGTIYLGQTLKFTKPVALGDAVTVKVTVANKDPEKHRVTFDCCCTNQKGDVVIVVAMRDRKVKRPRAVLPSDIRSRRAFSRADRTCENVPLHGSCASSDGNSLRGAIDAAQEGLITPVLIGPEAKIRSAAAAEMIDLSPYELVATEHSRRQLQRQSPWPAPARSKG
jgi:phosphate acetyltransferase/phosphate butyryltransferase